MSFDNDDTRYYGSASGSGETGGTWSWDGADSLVFSDYSGLGVLAQGDLIITLEGANETYYTEQEYGGITVMSGDLTITGDGSLDVTEEDYPAICSINGDVTIEGMTVSATTDRNKRYNAGVVGAIYAQNGSVDIVDSTVDATVLTPGRSEANREYTCAIGAYSYDSSIAPLINIDSSTVDASTPGGLALLANNWEGGIPGTIDISNSTMPAGVSVQNTAYGQTFGTSPDRDGVSSNVRIEPGVGPVAPVDPVDPANPVNPVEPAVLPLALEKAYAATADNASPPATGDAATGVVTTVAVAITAAGATLFGWRKMRDAGK